MVAVRAIDPNGMNTAIVEKPVASRVASRPRAAAGKPTQPANLS